MCDYQRTISDLVMIRYTMLNRNFLKEFLQLRDRGNCRNFPGSASDVDLSQNMRDHGQSGTAVKLFQAPRKISFTFYF